MWYNGIARVIPGILEKIKMRHKKTSTYLCVRRERERERESEREIELVL